MIDRRSAAEMPVTVEEWPAWPVNWGLKKQHSVEYWMMGSLLNVGGGREVVRVSESRHFFHLNVALGSLL